MAERPGFQVVIAFAEIRGVDRLQKLGQQRTGRLFFQERQQIDLHRSFVGERIELGGRFDEKVERVNHRHFRDQIDVDPEVVNRFRKDDPRQEVAKRVLLPIHVSKLFPKIGVGACIVVLAPRTIDEIEQILIGPGRVGGPAKFRGLKPRLSFSGVG